MDERYNPYYSPEKLNLSILSFDRPGMSYEYDMYLFVKTPDGRVYSCQDSGCSCPTPFDNYSATNMDAAIQGMERIGNYEDAAQQLKYWAKNYSSWIRDNEGCFLQDHHYEELKNWFPEEPKHTWD